MINIKSFRIRLKSETFNMLNVVLLVLLSVSCCAADDRFEREWNLWKTHYNKIYSTPHEEASKRLAWERNFDMVEEHNNNVHSNFRLEMNRYADREPSVRHAISMSDRNPAKEEEIEHNWTYLPSSFDWRTKGAISPVKNQGQMGSVLAVAATECMESYAFIKTGRLVSMSEPEIVDCCTHSSGLVTSVFNCIHKIGGLCSEATYPSVTGTCRNSSCTRVVQNKGTTLVPRGREDQLQIAVLHFPVMAIIDASRSSFQMYQSGIYDDPNCSATELDHAVQIVGYGSQGGNDFWIVKNSWGTEWGMDGYILMSRNKNNQCGIASEASYPV